MEDFLNMLAAGKFLSDRISLSLFRLRMRLYQVLHPYHVSK